MRSGSKSLRAAVPATIIALAMTSAALTGALAPGYAGDLAGARKITIVNGTRTAMVSLQTRQSQTGTWQADMLNRRPLGIQKQIEFEIPAHSTCFFDFKAMFEDGHRMNKSHVNLCKSTSYLLTDF